jgi:16S rRNA (guanine527-N7)-methyltransferase
VDSWINALTPLRGSPNIRHPHWGTPEEGNQAREGLGETRPRTGRVGEDRIHPRCAARRRRGRHSRRPRVHPQEGYLGRQREPLPTRVQGLPALPDAFHETLGAGLADLGIALRADQRRRLEDHVRLLIAWNAGINLTAVREPAEIARRHVLDSLTAAGCLRELGARRLIDLGSGGGFPGIPLAVALDADARLVESVGKKAAFLGAAVRALELSSVVADASRAEFLAADPEHRERWPAVTARAVAALGDLVELAFPLLQPGGVLLAWKRGDLDGELARAMPAIGQLGGGETRVLAVDAAGLPGHRLVVVRKTGRTGAGWPRDPAARRRRPW